MTRKSKAFKNKAEPWCGRTQKIIAVILSACALMGILWTSAIKADSRYAKEQVVAQKMEAFSAQNKYITNRLDLKIMTDQRNDVQNQVWKLEQAYEKRQMPVHVQDQYRRLQKELKELEEAVDKLQKEVPTGQRQM